MAPAAAAEAAASGGSLNAATAGRDATATAGGQTVVQQSPGVY